MRYSSGGGASGKCGYSAFSGACHAVLFSRFVRVASRPLASMPSAHVAEMCPGLRRYRSQQDAKGINIEAGTIQDEVQEGASSRSAQPDIQDGQGARA